MKAIPCPIHEAELRQYYLEDKLTDTQIAELLGGDVTVKRVRSWRKRFNIRTLARWERLQVDPIEGRLKSLLVGSMLGDGRLARQANTTGYVENHQVAQKKYLEWKVSIWGSWAKNGLDAIKPVLWKHEKKSYPGVRFNTVSHVSLNPWHEMFYPKKGPKSLSLEVVDHMDAFALAIWYLDDGCVGWWPNIIFGMDDNSRKVAWAIFEKFGLQPRWKVRKGNTGEFHMEREDTALKFLEIISPHVPVCMHCKIDNFGFHGPHYQVRKKLPKELLQSLTDQNVPIKRMARMLGAAATTVSRHLEKHGIDHPRMVGSPKGREDY